MRALIYIEHGVASRALDKVSAILIDNEAHSYLESVLISDMNSEIKLSAKEAHELYSALAYVLGKKENKPWPI